MAEPTKWSAHFNYPYGFQICNSDGLWVADYDPYADDWEPMLRLTDDIDKACVVKDERVKEFVALLNDLWGDYKTHKRVEIKKRGFFDL